MLFEIPIETKRLLLRSEAEADFDAVYRMNTDPAVMRYVGDGSVLSFSRDGFLERFRQLLAERRNEDYGLAAVVLKQTDEYIGACWLKYDDFLGAVELGYRYIKEAWDKGYATEAAEAVLQVGFKLPQLKEVYSRAHPENVASIRVIEKLGFVRVGRKYDPLLKTEVPVYVIKREDFRKT